MSKQDSNNQFSKEILNYFKSIETPDNKKWIQEYFEVLSDPSNCITEKSRKHHIRPCFTFKDENHKNRKDTQPLADLLNDNIIDLSIYNHIMAHYYLLQIFPNKDSKLAFQNMYGQERYKDNLSESEVKFVAKLIEDCAKKNITHEERKEQQRIYNNKNKEKLKQQMKEWYISNKEKEIKKRREYDKTNRKYKNEYSRLYYTINREQINNKRKEYDKIRDNQPCYDPIKGDYPKFVTLKMRILRNKELYKTVYLKDCILKN